MPYDQTKEVVSRWFTMAGGLLTEQGCPIKPETEEVRHDLLIAFAKQIILHPSGIVRKELAVQILTAANDDGFWQKTLEESISDLFAGNYSSAK